MKATQKFPFHQENEKNKTTNKINNYFIYSCALIAYHASHRIYL